MSAKMDELQAKMDELCAKIYEFRDVLMRHGHPEVEDDVERVKNEVQDIKKRLHPNQSEEGATAASFDFNFDYEWETDANLERWSRGKWREDEDED